MDTINRIISRNRRDRHSPSYKLRRSVRRRKTLAAHLAIARIELVNRSTYRPTLYDVVVVVVVVVV